MDWQMDLLKEKQMAKLRRSDSGKERQMVRLKG